MRISKRQLRRLILTELQSQRARDDVSAGSDRDDLKGHERPELELDEADEADAEEGDEKDEKELNEFRRRRASYRQLRRIIREEHEDWGMGAGEVSKTRPGEEDYSGHKGDESKTHPGEDFEGGGDVEHKAMTAMAAIHDLASAAGVELDTNISGPSDVRPEEEVGAFTMESRRRLKRRLRSIVRENIRRRR